MVPNSLRRDQARCLRRVKGDGSAMSALLPLYPPKADIHRKGRHGENVPIAEMRGASFDHPSARVSSDGGTVRPGTFAVLRLITSSNSVGG
jgi:hypothetical protein